LPMRSREGALSVASYNIHRCIGTDGSKRPDRVAKVISEIAVGVLALQEVDSSLAPHPGSGLELADLLPDDYTTVSGPTLFREDGTYGNILLTSRPMTYKKLHDLSVPGREPRGAIEVGIDVDGIEIHIVATHLGLAWRERSRQAKRLLEIIGPSAASSPLVLMGDFNEWNRHRRWYREIEKLMGKSPAPHTFPARRPLLALDRIWVHRPQLIDELTAHVTPLARVASDHLPVKARLSRSTDYG
jgi:endonuclease/exonuclease/phosphatase family metal-dependent hydrolase